MPNYVSRLLPDNISVLHVVAISCANNFRILNVFGHWEYLRDSSRIIGNIRELENLLLRFEIHVFISFKIPTSTYPSFLADE